MREESGLVKNYIFTRKQQYGTLILECPSTVPHSTPKMGVG